MAQGGALGDAGSISVPWASHWPATQHLWAKKPPLPGWRHQMGTNCTPNCTSQTPSAHYVAIGKVPWALESCSSTNFSISHQCKEASSTQQHEKGHQRGSVEAWERYKRTRRLSLRGTHLCAVHTFRTCGSNSCTQAALHYTVFLCQKMILLKSGLLPGFFWPCTFPCGLTPSHFSARAETYLPLK